MKRDITKGLLQWKNSPIKKPLIVKGARQVGKTYSINEFGKQYYESNGAKSHCIDFRESPDIYTIFEDYLDPVQIIKYLQFKLKISIDIENDLLIFDEIQECPKAVTALKYFAQNMPQLDLIAAGSHLGLLHSEASFPVGKVSFLYMHPLHFNEFLLAIDHDAYTELLNYNLDKPLPQIVHERILEIFSYYLFCGGLPEVVDVFKTTMNNLNQAIKETRKIQNDLITGYYADFAKYSGVVNATHLKYVFESIPTQLSKTHDEVVKKYLFKDVIPRRKGFEAIRGPLQWLEESRLCIKSYIAKHVDHPLKGYIDENKFKVYLFDTGILNCILNVPGEVILGENIGPYRGFIIENFIAQEIFACQNQSCIAWQEGNAELEFLILKGKDIIPLEVKSVKRARKAKSLDSYINRYTPEVAYKLTAQNFGYNEKRKIFTIPLYCAHKII